VQPYLEALCERGILALPAGPNVLRLLPPLVITDAQVERVLAVVAEVLTTPVGGTRGASSSRASMDAGRTETDASARPATTSVTPDHRPTDGNEGPDRISSVLTEEVALLYNMLRINSYSGEEGALARFLVEQAQQMGLHAYVDEAGNFVASTHETLDAQPLVLLGHMDTVRGDVPVRIEDGLLYGRGAVDAKGPLAAFVCATARVRTTLQRPVVIVGAVEEEAATSRGARAVVERYRPSACIIGEPSGSDAVTIGYKGRLLVECVATRSSSHSAGPLQSSSEVATAFWERVRRSAEEWNQRYAPNSAFAALQPSLRTINNEHDGLEDRTRLVIGYRLPPNYDIAGLRAQLEQWAGEADAQLSFSGEEVAFQSTRTTPLARAFIAALRARGVQPTFKYKTGTSDMNIVGPHWGQNIVAYGPGDARLDHTPQEHIRIAEYSAGIDVLSAVLLAQQGEMVL
jgi:N-acetyl-ornithine/N-acetyl-lysine deacetylase